MILLLAIEGRLQDYKSFPSKINRGHFRSRRYDQGDLFAFRTLQELRGRAYNKKQWSIYFDITWVMIMSAVSNFFKGVANDLLFLCQVLNNTFNPVRILYRLSKKLKQRSPAYAEYINNFKKKLV